MTRLPHFPALRKPASFTQSTRFARTSAAGLALALMAAPAHSAPPTGLEVHEWGTFTTLNSSAGKSLAGLYVDATRLPDFVHGLPYFNYDPLKGWATLDRLRNVTVKMETPVLYFYSQKETAVDVKVDFPGGTISQWYPVCYESETNPTAPSVDFAAAPYPGHAAWKATVLAPGPELPFTTTASGKETGEWTAPRYTAANQLRGAKGEIEKFLFYRGLGNFPSAVDMRFLTTGMLQVKNGGNEDIPYLMVYEMPASIQPGMGMAKVWFQGPMKAGQEIQLNRDKPSAIDAMGAMEDFRLQLVKAGLTMEESRAMLNTWYNGYFIEGGLKAFWILPRAMVDRVLPLTVTPLPDKIERVMVGRSEILTPEFEQTLFHAQAKDSLEAKFGADKYRLAYADFLSKGKDWHITTSSRDGFPDGKGGAPRATSSRGSFGSYDVQGRALRTVSPFRQ
jgi:hypothetical protein